MPWQSFPYAISKDAVVVTRSQWRTAYLRLTITFTRNCPHYRLNSVLIAYRLVMVLTTVDCIPPRDGADHDKGGCYPSTLHKALRYAWKDGLHLNEDYPYVGERRPCQASDIEQKMKIETYRDLDVTQEGEEGLNCFIHDQPIAAFMDLYDSFRRHRGKDTYMGAEEDESKVGKHALLILGFGMDKNRVKYFLVKNSWGKNWGYHGYAKVKRELISGFVYPYKPFLLDGNKFERAKKLKEQRKAAKPHRKK